MQNNLDATPRSNSHGRRVPTTVAIGAAGAAALAAAALYNHGRAREAERAHPPKGQFIDVSGVRIHYVEAGAGEPLVLLHGNGTSLDEIMASGLFALAAKRYRVIAFDRPGFGHSERPRGTVWTAARQAALIAQAMKGLHADQALVFGHSWGTLVALNLALDHPLSVRAVVLAGGYFFPSARADAFLLSPPAVPIIGDIFANTIAPIVSRLLWKRLVKRMFAPAKIEPKFRAYAKEIAVRPRQLQAAAEESALMIGEAGALEQRYGEIRQPIALIAGQGDRIVDTKAQSARLHRLLPSSTFESVPGVGHMVHETATQRVMAAIDRAASAASTPPRMLADQIAAPGVGVP